MKRCKILRQRLRDTVVIILKWAKLYRVSLNKCSAVAEMGDRLAKIDTGRKIGAALPPFFLGGGGRRRSDSEVEATAGHKH